MDSKYNSLLDKIASCVLELRHPLLIALIIFDIWLFSKRKTSATARVFAILLALFLAGIVVWWNLFWLLHPISS